MIMKIAAITGLLMLAHQVTATTTGFINAKIFTGTDISSDDAFTVKDGRFAQFGKSDEIKKALTKRDEVIDLNGALVIPGFIEAHAHILSLGQSRMALDLRRLSKAAIVEKVAAQAKKQQADTWIVGRGWDQNLWADKKFPHKDLFSDIAQPVLLRRVDGHALWVNDAALTKAGIDNHTKDPAGGQIIRDKNGKATGVLIDNAMDIINKQLATPSRKDIEQQYFIAEQEALSRGITSLHDAGANAQAIALFEDLAKHNKLSLRLYVMIDGSDQTLVDKFFARGPLIGEFLTVRGIKYFADGALGSRGASLLEHYHDDPQNRGLMLIDKSTLIAKTKQAIAKGFQVATHAIGDGANRVVLDAYEEVLAKTNQEQRLRVEHAQLIDPQDHGRFKQLSLIASMQPIHCTSDMTWVHDRLGTDRLKDRAYPWRSLLNAGATLAFGSDSPVEDINPLLGIFAAVTRTNREGLPAGGFLPEQKLKLSEALNAYHGGAAYAEFNENHKGKIAKGFLADFAVFDTDILHPDRATFVDAKPKITVVNGKIVFTR